MYELTEYVLETASSICHVNQQQQTENVSKQL